jgi:ABC-type transport system, involved in lipoprotein release, permease component
MRSSLLITIKKIQKRKIQNLLIGIIVASSALLLSTGIGVMLSMNKPIDRMFAEVKSSHDLFIFNEKYYDRDKIENWWKSQSEVDEIQTYNQLTLGPNIKVNGGKLSNEYNFLSEVPENKGDIDNFKMVQGNEIKSPGESEVWVNTGFADLYKVKLGDTLSIDDRNYKISGILVDTQFSSLMMGTQRFWVKPGELQKYPEYKNGPGYALSIRYKNPSSSDAMWHRFEKYINAPLIGSAVRYSDVYSCYATILKFTGVFMIFFSIITIITAVSITRFVISNSIYNDYKNIGIYKALGFSSKDINLIYVLQYFIISFVFATLGIAGSKFTIDKMIASNLKTIGMDSIRSSYVVPFTVTFIIIISVVIITSLLCARKTNTIKPVEAMRENTSAKHVLGRNALNSRLFNIFPPSAAVGIRGIINNKKSAAVIFITILITLFSGLSGVNLLHTTDAIGRNLGYWGFDNSMVDVKQKTWDDAFIKELEQDIKNDNRVKNYSTFNFYQDTSFVNKNGDIEKFTTVQVLGDRADSMGFTDMEGRDPLKGNEVSVSVNTARDNNIHVGDYMQVYIKDKKYDLLVVGIYQSLNNLGKGMRLYEGTVKEADPNYVYSILLDLKDKSSINSYMDDMKSKYGEKIIINDRQSEFDGQISMMNSGSTASVMMIIVIMLSICFLNIFNIVLMNINQERKNYGIYKAIGMTSGQIRNSIVIRISLVFLFALIFALLLTLKATPALMSLIFINVGIARYPVSISVSNMILIAIVSFVFSIFSCLSASKMITKIKLRSLIEE